MKNRFRIKKSSMSRLRTAGFPIMRWITKGHAIRREIAANYEPEKYQVTEEEKQELAGAPMLESANTHLAVYVMLPIRFEDGKPIIDWVESWKLEDYES